MRNYVQEVLDELDNKIGGLPDELLDLYGLLVFVKGENVTLEDVHDAWAIWKNRIRPDHKSLIPFNDLTLEVQELDRKYADAIASVKH
ncbi:hypothetical protein SEA_FAUST_203 [Streptomyces phage Faust]|uniref:DUF7701 domain-containing protein n=1 Tax=Streptomyces phage Faust TaxID=2767565 RepID=A0A7G9UZ20_9CAUD|nr:hypothetical protein PP456_gp084 [Streptomyces phage Faust]QNN99275.1 hypothetical protein SEA_FAUST_203 [Streptomyces phage Faust]